MTAPPRFQHRLYVAVEFEKSPKTIDGPTGIRKVLHVGCGTFAAGEVTGTIVPGSGDWVLERRDGSLELDIRFTLAPNDGAPVFMRSQGLFIASHGIVSQIRGGDDVPASEYYFRTSVMFETSDERLLDLNRHLHVGVGTRTATGMTTEIFAVV
jgi:Protein of unknown function (DUF3237)